MPCFRWLRPVTPLATPPHVQVALLSCGPLLSQVPLFARHPLLLEEVAPLLQRTVALPGERLASGTG